MTEQNAPPVVVVGAGLAGSAAAALLAHAGVPVTVFERRDRPSDRPRAWVMSARSQEILRGLGLDERVRALGSPGPFVNRAADTLLDVAPGVEQPDPAIDVSPTGSALCDQDIVESVLRDYATTRGARFHWGTEVTDLIDDGDAVRVRGVGDGSVRADYVIAADGARALLRERLGITQCSPTEEFGEFDQVLLRSAELDALMEHRPGHSFVCRDADTLVFRRDLGRWQIQRYGTSVGTTPEEVTATIAATVGRPVTAEILDHSSWRPCAALADRFRAGRVFLIGDAAHAMPPSLGMAGNLAIADAHNLAWKIAWARSGRAGAALLDSYQAERRPVAQVVLDASVAVTRGERRLDLVTAALGLGYPPASSTALAGPGSEVSIGDPRRAIVGGRLPHRWLPDGRSTIDLTDVDHFAVVADASAAMSESVWLVRPDGHIAAHLPPGEIENALSALLDRDDPDTSRVAVRDERRITADHH